MNKKIIIMFLILTVWFIIFTGCTVPETDPPEKIDPEEDYIEIISVTPNSGLTETSTDFTIKFKYSLASMNTAFIDITFNSGDNPDHFYTVNTISIKKEIKEVQYTVTETPKNHAADTFRLNIIMYDSSHNIIRWAEEILTF